MWCQAIRGLNMRCMHNHVETFCAQNSGSAPAYLPVTCILLSTPCSQSMANSSAHVVHVEMHRLTKEELTLQVVQVVLQPPCFSRWSHFRNVLKFMYVSSARTLNSILRSIEFSALEPSDQPFHSPVSFNVISIAGIHFAYISCC